MGSAGPRFINELEERGLSVKLHVEGEADIKPKEGQIGQIRLGRMTVPDLRGFPWSDIFRVMQGLGASAQIPGIFPHQDRSQPIQMDRDLPTWTRLFPEPGEYEIAAWSVAGEPIRGGMLGLVADNRAFLPEQADSELRAAGFRGAANLFLLAHATEELIFREGKRLTLGEPPDRLVEKGREYTPWYAFEREVNDHRAIIPLRWELKFAKVDVHYYADNQVFGFRPTAK